MEKLKNIWGRFKRADKKPLKKEVFSALILLVLILSALGGWLYTEAEKTLEIRHANLPVVEALITLARPETTTQTTTQATTPDSSLVPPPEEIKEPIKEEAKEEVKEVESVQVETAPEEPKEIQQAPPVVTEDVRDVSAQSAPEAPEIKVEETFEAQSLIPEDMVIAPLRDLVEQKAMGNLPIVGAKGEMPWHMYGRYIPKSDNKAHIALVMNNVGLSRDMLNEIFEKLPNTVNLAFNPYAENIASMIEQARDKKFEPLMLLPMQATNFPNNDAGPQALLSDVSQTQNMDNLYWTLSRGTGYVGLMNYMGSDFLKNKSAAEPVFKDISNRGLLFVDSLAGTGYSVAEELASVYNIPYIAADLIVDEYPVQMEIEKQLRALEILANEFGYAVGVINPLPLSINTVGKWAKTLEKQNIVLVPLSNIVEKKMDAKNANKAASPKN